MSNERKQPSLETIEIIEKAKLFLDNFDKYIDADSRASIAKVIAKISTDNAVDRQWAVEFMRSEGTLITARLTHKIVKKAWQSLLDLILKIGLP